MRALDVFLHRDCVGRLERLPQARLAFAYHPAWLARGEPLSLALPLREEPFSDEECRPFFAGLLPEGEFLRAVARAFHVSVENSFSLLEEIGGECAGAISLVARGGQPPFKDSQPPRWLEGDGLERLLDELPSRPLLVGLGEDEGIRLSLAGTRDKLPVLWEGDRIGIARGNPPSTHIIKKPITELRDMVANEAYCLALAAESRLVAAEAMPLRAGAHEALLVRRYDRSDEPGGEVHRIHQEDFCQALGVLPAEKYEADGGPGVAACATLIRHRVAAPAVDLLRFLDALVFNLVIGNTDAHAKNYSLLLEGEGSPRLAPLYDLLSARAYWPYEQKMAMKYGGEYRGDRIRSRHLDRLAADLDISSGLVRRRVSDVAETISVSADAARRRLPGGWQDVELLDEIQAVVEAVAGSLLRTAVEGD